MKIKFNYVENDPEGKKFHVYKEYVSGGKFFTSYYASQRFATFPDALEFISSTTTSFHLIGVFENGKAMKENDPRLVTTKTLIDDNKLVSYNRDIDRPDI
jgi:hypothetical protein